MNIWKYMKSNKVFFLLSLAAAVLGTLAGFLFGGCSKKAEKDRVIVSKRVKIDVKEAEGTLPSAGKKTKVIAPAGGKGAAVESFVRKGARGGKKTAAEGTKRRAAHLARRPHHEKTRVASRTPLKKTKTRAIKTLMPWAVNVASFTRSSDAERLRKRLTRKGYNTYITEFTLRSTRYYRVRVGFYPTREAASRTGRVIARTYRNVGTPWVVKPGMEEVVAHTR